MSAPAALVGLNRFRARNRPWAPVVYGRVTGMATREAAAGSV
jgi:hypothetical protein